jgi:hypothetical protein
MADETPNVHFDADDSSAVIAATNTADGSGFDDVSELPVSDFVSFATDGVEVEVGPTS